MRILWASPLPPIRSGVSDYAVELLSELATLATVRVLCPPGWSPERSWPLDGLVELVDASEPAHDGELTLVHIGNNPHHSWLLDRLDDPRPVAVLHDLVLHHLLVECSAGGDGDDPLEERLGAAHGAPGASLAAARRLGVTGARDPFLFPALGAFLDSGVLGVVVHSRWAAAQVRRQFPKLPCTAVGLAAVDPGAVDRDRVRAELGVADTEVVLMHLGFLTPEKGLHEVLAGLAAARRCGVGAHLVLVGEGEGLKSVLEIAGSLGVRDRVTVTGWIDRERFLKVPAAADLGIVLRTPSAGETSAAVVRFLACGTPAAVIGLHQFLEWPEAAAPRVTPGPSAAADVGRVLVAASDQATWSDRRKAARAAYLAAHQPPQVAAELTRFLKSIS